MSKHDPVKDGQAIILQHKDLGFVRGWARQDSDFMPGTSSAFRAAINSPALPGISEAVFNTNSWAVFDENDPVVLKLIADQYVKHEITR